MNFLMSQGEQEFFVNGLKLIKEENFFFKIRFEILVMLS